MEEDKEKLNRVKDKIEQIEKEEGVKISAKLHLPQYVPEYLPDEVRLAYLVLKRYEVQFIVHAEVIKDK